MKQRGKNKNELKEMRKTSETSGTMLNAPAFESEVSKKTKKKKKKERKKERKGMRKYLRR